mmetsp:Transcript_39208/g.65054  ORF Transcript_39208/g.65054 Transcript_39208/m.65054 type:complete len:212 (-) Transcript_39208:661-1296(-)
MRCNYSSTPLASTSKSEPPPARSEGLTTHRPPSTRRSIARLMTSCCFSSETIVSQYRSSGKVSGIFSPLELTPPKGASMSVASSSVEYRAHETQSITRGTQLACIRSSRTIGSVATHTNRKRAVRREYEAGSGRATRSRQHAMLCSLATPACSSDHMTKYWPDPVSRALMGRSIIASAESSTRWGVCAPTKSSHSLINSTGKYSCTSNFWR